MRTFDYEALANKKWDMDIVTLVAKIHECKGRQDLFVRQKPAELERLVEIALEQDGSCNPLQLLRYLLNMVR